jgi:hypothetical protein
MLGLLHDLLLSVETSSVGIRTNSVSHLKVKLVKRFSGDLKQAIAQFIKCNCSAALASLLIFPCILPPPRFLQKNETHPVLMF